MSCYQHLSMEELESLMLFLEQGKSIGQTSNELKWTPSTISRGLLCYVIIAVCMLKSVITICIAQHS